MKKLGLINESVNKRYLKPSKLIKESLLGKVTSPVVYDPNTFRLSQKGLFYRNTELK